ncbi:MAG: T9SS type A sorting domain-containing protein [Bacteroidales bacterium]|nr:T9SS type A sorting domain-containing protein [Bacteroidales bacterium]
MISRLLPTLICWECSYPPTTPTITVRNHYRTTTDPLTYNSQGSYIIHWNFDDGNGNSVNVNQNVIVDDITAPVAPTLADLTGECSVTAIAPTTTDNCAGSITGTTTDPLTYNSQGSYIIHWNFADGNGNSVNVNQNVIVDDITAPLSPTLADLTGECSVTAIAPTTTDNCAGSITGTTTDPLTYNSQGSYIIHWNFDDGNGNSVNVNQNVIVDDITAPVAPTLADLTGECSVTAIAPTTTDNCAGSITGTTTDPLTYNSQGSYIIHWNFADGNGNSVNVNQNVIVDDITAPVAPTLADLTGECSVTAIAPTTTDNCTGSITGTTTDPQTYTEQGTYVIHWNFDDGNGNTSTQNQNVFIADITDPEIACPDDRIVFLNEGETYYTIVGNELDPVSVNDNCTLDNYFNSINNEQTLAGEQLAIGTTSIVWYATDIAGNTDTCSMVVQVNYLSSINEQETIDHMIYPNPSNGMVKVYLNANSDYTVKVWDAQGRLIIEKLSNIRLQEINLLAAPTGVYYFQIIYNGRVINDKVIIH